MSPHLFLPRLLLVTIALTAMTQLSHAQDERISTREDRAALVDYLIQKTIEREAFSEIKNKRLGIDPIEEMRKLRKEIINAKSNVELFYSLHRLSNARHDRHLFIQPVQGGPHAGGAFRKLPEQLGFPKGTDRYDISLPMSFAVDFANVKKPELFISRATVEHQDLIGARVKKFNGRAVSDFADAAKPYFAFSTLPNFWMEWAERLNRISALFPPTWYASKDVTLLLERTDGTLVQVDVSYEFRESLRWPEEDSTRVKYTGFEKCLDFESFDVYQPGDGQRIILLDWRGFSDDLTKATDTLVKEAEKNGWFDYDLIIDCTQCGGGRYGAYAVQRLTSKPFKTTFGNLRLSDLAQLFVDDQIKRYEARYGENSKVSEVPDDRRWQYEWLSDDVRKGIAAGEEYSDNVPFKCAHLPKYSDGILHPAEKHFRGKMICWFSPHGGSHLDHFAAIIRDNNLAWTIGMPTGGFRNTWETSEQVKFPLSGKPAVEFMGSIGHTIRTNGEVLEGNPADVDEFFPMTRDNYLNYRDMLLEKSLARLREMRQ